MIEFMNKLPKPLDPKKRRSTKTAPVTSETLDVNGASWVRFKDARGRLFYSPQRIYAEKIDVGEAVVVEYVEPRRGVLVVKEARSVEDDRASNQWLS